MKKYINVEKEDGTYEEMEVVLVFKLEETGKDYIIYKSKTSDEYFAASYNKELEYVNFNTEFTNDEKEKLQEIFKLLVKGGEPNA